MTHAEAKALGAVEKYLLNELSPDQCDEFEEHYFVCRQCAEEVEVLSDTVEVIRKGVTVNPPKAGAGYGAFSTGPLRLASATFARWGSRRSWPTSRL